MIDIVSINRYYSLQSSTANPPGKPTTNPPPSAWSLTEPAYTAGSTNTLYTVELTIFTNDTFKYSEVSKSSSYEAAKQAYNKAVGVENRIVTAETSIQQNKDAIELKASKTDVANIRVGAKNLAENTNKGKRGWGWSMQTGNVTILDHLDKGIRCCKMLRGDTAQTGFSYIFYNDIGRTKYEPDMDYIISFDVYPNVEGTFKCILMEGNASNIMTGWSEQSSVTASKWNKVELKLHTLTTLPSGLQVLYMIPSNSNVNTSYIFKNLKIEKGNKSTDWTPAPEDVIADIEAISMGTRNLFEGTNQGVDGWDWKGIPSSGTYTATEYLDNDVRCCKLERNNDGGPGSGEIRYANICPKKYEPSTEYMLSFDVFPNGASSYYLISMADNYGTSRIFESIQTQPIVANVWNKVSLKVVTNATLPTEDLMNQHFRITGVNSSKTSSVILKNLKMEKGNKASDWTPAPEDVVNSIDNKSDELYQVIEEQTTSITQNCEGIVLEAVKEYTKTGDFDTFVQSVKSQLELLANQMTLSFTQTTTEINNINNDLNNKFNTITKYFKFDINGLEIGQSDSPYKVIIDNDKYCMTANDVEVMWIENGHVYTPEITISKKLNMFGFELEPDSSGNVNLSYVGG